MTNDLQTFIAESRKVCDAATEDWFADCDLRDDGAHQICRLVTDHPAKSLTVCFMATPKEDTEADMVFIAHARTALPDALARLESLAAENERLRQQLEKRAAITDDELERRIAKNQTTND